MTSDQTMTQFWRMEVSLSNNCPPGVSAASDGPSALQSAAEPNSKTSLDIPVESPVIRRLIQEVRSEEVDVPRSYNRTFNRHNR